MAHFTAQQVPRSLLRRISAVSQTARLSRSLSCNPWRTLGRRQNLSGPKRTPTTKASNSKGDEVPATKGQVFEIPVPTSSFCRKCGGRMILSVPEGDDKERYTCVDCNYIDYFNPKMVVGCIVEHEKKILMCKRGIEPCKGMWTLPAGFMEMNESTKDGAVRETWEEANAVVKVVSPYAYLDIPVISQTHILFRAILEPPYEFSSGPETLETRLFAPHEIPFDEIAFSTVSITLRHYIEDMKSGIYRIHHAEVVKVPGAHPNDPRNHKLACHFSFHGSAQEEQE